MLKAVIVLLALLAAPLGLMGCGAADLDFPTEYQAVYLDNGQVFFGKISETGAPYPLLRDAFFVQTQVDREKKETKNLLIRRGSEGHGPDFMRLNSRHIVVIEPVAPDSRVAQLIREAKAPRPPETKEAPKTPAGK
jgi:hypothetical protein